MRPSLATLLLATLALGAAAAAPAAPVPVPARRPAPAASALRGVPPGEEVAVIETVLGRITLRLFPADAPRTVANFRKLVSEHFYDGLTFHRVVPGFVIQGGDPNSRNDNPFDDGQGGPGWTLPAEIKRLHERGAVAMARQPDAVNPKRESNGSQFYIALRPLPNLDGAYTVFGQVLSGWDTIDRLVALADRKDIARQNENANPGKLALIQRVLLVRAADVARLPAAARTAPADSSRR